MKQPPNIILIIFDTTRMDTIYDNVNELQAFSLLCNHGVLYHNAVSPASWTIPSHASLFTGKYPSEHGIHYYFRNKDTFSIMAQRMDEYARSADSIPKILQGRGYSTISLHCNRLISSDSCFGEGFDVCKTLGPWGLIRDSLRKIIEEVGWTYNPLDIARKAVNGQTNEVASALVTFLKSKYQLKRVGFPKLKGGSEIISYLKAMKLKEPFFLFLNFMESHEPYFDRANFFRLVEDAFEMQLLDLAGLKPFPKRYMDRVRMQYNRETFVLDGLLSELLSMLKGLNLFDNTLIVLTSDHGQALKEKDFFGHGLFLYDELTRIPMIVKYPYSEKPKPDGNLYTSLVYVKQLLESWSSGESAPLLQTKSVFSEEYSIPIDVIDSKLGKDFHLKYDVIRKSAWMNGYKVTVDGSNGILEEVSKYGVEVKPDFSDNALKETLKELEIFCGIENFKIPTG